MSNNGDDNQGPHDLHSYPELMTRAHVAEYLHVSVSTLSRWARDGRGPRCIYLAEACPRYRRPELEDYLNEIG